MLKYERWPWIERFSAHLLQQADLYWYGAVLLINLIPVFAVPYFVTLDGPSHQYNAELMWNILVRDDPWVQQFHTIELKPTANWLYYLLMLSFRGGLGSYLAHKCILGLYFLLLPLAFRYLIKAVYPRAGYTTYLVFPYLHNAFLGFGFFNLLFSAILCLFALGYVLRYPQPNRVQAGILMLLLLLLYSAHILGVLVFLLVFGTVLLLQLAAICPHPFTNPNDTPRFLRLLSGWLHARRWLFGACIPLLLAVGYFFFSTENIHTHHWAYDFSRLTRRFGEFMSSHLMLHPATSGWMLMRMAAILAVVILLLRLLKIRPGDPGYKTGLHRVLGWAILPVLLTYFLIPASFGYVGEMDLRMLYFLVLLFAAWVGSFPWPRILTVCMMILSLTVIRDTLYYSMNYWQTSSRRVEQLMEALPHIKSASTLLPINYCSDMEWHFLHLADYLGTRKKVVIYENYEAELPWFHTRWKPPYQLKGLHTPCGATRDQGIRCEDIENWERTAQYPMDYVLEYGDLSNDVQPPHCRQRIEAYLLQHYELVYHNEFVRLYERKDVSLPMAGLLDPSCPPPMNVPLGLCN